MYIRYLIVPQNCRLSKHFRCDLHNVITSSPFSCCVVLAADYKSILLYVCISPTLDHHSIFYYSVCLSLLILANFFSVCAVNFAYFILCLHAAHSLFDGTC